jgi:hypothetical protein
LKYNDESSLFNKLFLIFLNEVGFIKREVISAIESYPKNVINVFLTYTISFIFK